ncbi:response regulator transcription factor [Phenylobacterium sp.]|uniref:response regulator transcription factor n=1 Tax=Phenylobacterium sp. TaxID=1871053 RepID=UPI0011F6FB09|nr:response regulator transcription factor [Phenylobacterium sp.]THD71160.1 MAG: response regulator [Phenylobacterium sp.]
MPSFEPTKRRILAVDDDRAVLELVCTRLTLAGYDVFSARDGHEALARLTTLKPAAMVLDLGMPGLDGFGVLQKMGKIGTASTPTLVLTARHSAPDVKRAIGLGARDYLSKPFNDNQLLMRVQRLFRRPVEARSLEALFTDVEQLLG